MQKTKSLKELTLCALAVFLNEKHANVNIVYAAEDGNVFIEENRAKLHVIGTKFKYCPITRLEAGGERKEQEMGTDEDLVAERTKELQELDFTMVKYDQLKSLALFFELDVENMKAPTLVTALTEYKNKISA